MHDPSKLPDLAEIIAVNPLFFDEGIDTKEAARILGCSPATLETKRSRGGGPPYCKRGKKVTYTRRGCLEWQAEGRRRSTSDQGTAA